MKRGAAHCFRAFKAVCLQVSKLLEEGRRSCQVLHPFARLACPCDTSGLAPPSMPAGGRREQSARMAVDSAFAAHSRPVAVAGSCAMEMVRTLLCLAGSNLSCHLLRLVQAAHDCELGFLLVQNRWPRSNKVYPASVAATTLTPHALSHHLAATTR